MTRGLAAGVAGVLVLVAACTPSKAREPAASPEPTPRGADRSTTTFALRVVDRATGAPIGARVQLFSSAEVPLHIGWIDVYATRQGGAGCAYAPDVVGSWDGLIVARGVAELPVGVDTCLPSPGIPYGRYHVWAWRGVEYELWQGEVDLSAERGRVPLEIALDRAWTPHGALAADLHVHALASTDAAVPNPQRVVAQVAAGIQVIGLSDHDTHGDLDEEIRALGLDDRVASIASAEVTADRLHVGVYPVEVDRTRPGNGALPHDEIAEAEPADIFARLRALPGRPIIQLNHPRLRSSALYDDAEWDGVAWPPPFSTDFDAVEVVAGYTAFNAAGDRRLDESVRDFYTFVDHGRLITPLGNSDTHGLNWVHDGTARSYVFVDDDRLRPFDEAAFVAALRARRVVATTGPWLDVEVAAAEGAAAVGPGQALQARGTVWVDVTVHQARFVVTERLRIQIGRREGPGVVRMIDVPPHVRSYRWAGAIEVGTADTWIGITADGDRPLPTPLTGAYQRHAGRQGVTPFAIASPILVDADGDHRWSRRGAVVHLR